MTLKQNNLSTKFKYIYPRIGGTATAHRINLVDPTTFIGTFSGGWTHDGSGALPNGTNGYMNTNCKYDTPNFDRDDQCFFFDSKTNTDGLYVDIGCQGTGNADINMFTRLGGNLNTRICDGTNSPTAVADSLGLFALSRYSGTEYKQYKEGSVVATKTVSSLIYSATKYDIYEAAANNTGSNIQHSPRKRTLHGSGKSMTDTEMGNFVTAWRTLETTLNR